MPRVNVNKEVFDQKIGKTYEFNELEELCFDFGMEVEIKEEEDPQTKKVTLIYIFETAANRPDLLSCEGIVNALLVYLGKLESPQFVITNKDSEKQRIVVKKNTEQIRPFVVGCILRDITFDEESYQSFIDLQTKLHFNLCRKRRLVAIGTHDLDTITGPYVYDARKPEDISFISLNQTKQMNGVEMMAHYEQDKNLREFVPIIKDSPVYPVILDSKDVVMSLPPIINGNHSKMSKDTKNVFIECTATDYTRAIQALNVMITSFSQYCKNPYHVEAVEILYEETGKVEVTPDLTCNEFEISVQKVQKLGTFETNQEQVCTLLRKMQFGATPLDQDRVKVSVPPFRSDILQECDIAEDVCIAFGYNNIKKQLPSAFTIGKQQILNKLSDLIREEIAAVGYQEGLNFALNNEDDLTTKLCRKQDLDMVKIQNPRTTDFTCGRTTLIPGCLKWLAHNRVNKLPIKLFELSDVILKDQQRSVGARNERRICALYYNKSAQLEIIHGLIDIIMQKLNIPSKLDAQEGQASYALEPIETATFFPERQARILFNNKEIGVIGILHPNVLAQYSLDYPVSLVEINLEPLFQHFTENQ